MERGGKDGWLHAKCRATFSFPVTRFPNVVSCACIFSEIVFDFRNRDPSLSSFLRMAGVKNAASGRDGGETAVKNSGIRTRHTSWRP
jgi:hypothetical protein